MGSVMLWGYEETLLYYGWAPFDPFSPSDLEALEAKVSEARELATKIIEANYVASSRASLTLASKASRSEGLKGSKGAHP
jgi:hypothetical protein